MIAAPKFLDIRGTPLAIGDTVLVQAFACDYLPRCLVRRTLRVAGFSRNRIVCRRGDTLYRVPCDIAARCLLVRRRGGP
jgi:hypothetical protein